MEGDNNDELMKRFYAETDRLKKVKETAQFDKCMCIVSNIFFLQIFLIFFFFAFAKYWFNWTIKRQNRKIVF